MCVAMQTAQPSNFQWMQLPPHLKVGSKTMARGLSSLSENITVLFLPSRSATSILTFSASDQYSLPVTQSTARPPMEGGDEGRRGKNGSKRGRIKGRRGEEKMR